ncbi:unnamed protein product [Mesocestoides corti]|uniref:SCP domain-containing protein n=1 Tax=Mesocestoides corti TaxID=53468 RepID=A0A0R3U1A7_MESCO|nr:unnamed protein product [Mesocestoides corti]
MNAGEQSILIVDTEKVLRSLHGCPPLTFALDLAVSAQVYAEKLAGLGTIRHSGYSDVGENLALSLGPSQSTDFSGVMVTLLWYNEISDYEFTGVDQISCGHFSQVVWKETKSIGMGLARTEDGQVIVAVAHYRPPGNVSGQWAANVPYPVQGTAHSPTAEELCTFTVQLDEVAKELARELKCGLIKKIQPGYVFGKPVRHYSECSRLLDKNGNLRKIDRFWKVPRSNL